MIKDKIMMRLNEMCIHILFDYNNIQCGIDPISRTHYDMWYGNETITVSSIDEVMSVELFDGKSLNEIADIIENVEGI